MKQLLHKSKSGARIHISILLCMFLPALAWGQETISVTGTVIDDQRQIIPGVNVLVEGTNVGSATDVDGHYAIQAPSDATLIFSFVGFTTKNVPVNGQSVIDVQLTDDILSLDEVVVVGYGTQRKGDVSSAVAHVDEDEFVKAPVRDIGQLLQGKVAGLQVSNNNGDPTSSPSIFLRGTSSISNPTPPLVLIDGVVGNLKDFAPEDVATIDILKDGSAAAIYGTRANSGVILITTKNGNKNGGAPQLNFNISGSVQKIARKPDLLSAEEYRQAIDDGIIPESSDRGASTDWIDEITRDAIIQTYELSLRGGDNQTSYYGSINYRDFEGILINSENSNLYANINVNHKMFDNKLSVTFGLNTREEKFTTNGDGQSYPGTIYRDAFIGNPTAPVLKPEGAGYAGPYYQSFAIFTNPVSRIRNTDGENTTQRTRIYGSVALTPIEPLTLTVTASQTSNNSIQGYYENKLHPSTLNGGLNGYASKAATEFKDRSLDMTAQYKKGFDKHNFTILGGYSYFGTVYQRNYQYAYNFASDFFSYHNMSTATNLGPTGELQYLDGRPFVDSDKNSYNIIAGFARVNYNFDDRLLFTATYRREGSSKFVGSNDPWGDFYGISGAWRLSNESFVENVEWINDLKLRLGYGITGAAPTGYYLGLSQLALSDVNSSFYYNGQFVQTLYPFQNPNPDLTWEEKKETDLGLDFGLFHNRLVGSVDYYYRQTDGLLFNFPVPQPPNLVGTTFTNAGKIENKGLEVSLNFEVMRKKDFVWNAQLLGSTNKNTFLSFSEDPRFNTGADFIDIGATGEPIQQSTHRLTEGEPVGNFFGRKVIDITEDGKWVYEDLNDDGQITNDDRQILGNGIPKYHLGLNQTFLYKNFDLTVTMRGAFDYQILNFDRMFYEQNQNIERNRLKSALDPVFGKTVLTEPETYNSYYIEDGDFWKIDNIVLGYNYRPDWPFLKEVRIYISTLNAFVFSGYKGLDPELSPEGISPGNDGRDKYPTTRTFTLGLNVTF